MQVEKVISGVKAFNAFNGHLSYATIDKNIVIDDTHLNIPSSSAGLYLPPYNKLLCYDRQTNKSYFVDIETLQIDYLSEDVTPCYSIFCLKDKYLVNTSTYENGELNEKFYWRHIGEQQNSPQLPVPGGYFGRYINNGMLVFHEASKGLICVHEDTNEIAWTRTVFWDGMQNVAAMSESPQAFKLNTYLGFYDTQLFFSTKTNWLVCIDATTGNLLWVLKNIEGEITRQDTGLMSTSSIRVDKEKGTLYCFDKNIYWEWDINAQQLITLVNNQANAEDNFYGPGGYYFFAIGDFIYYTYSGFATKIDGRKAWPRFVCVSKNTGELIDYIEFKRKKGEEEFDGWQDLKFDNNKFYLLGRNGLLSIIAL